MAANKLKSTIASTFKMNGLTLRSDATRYLVEILMPITDSQKNDSLEKLVELIQNSSSLTSSMVSRELCEQAVKDCNAESNVENSEKTFSIIDAFDVPRFVYEPSRKKFLQEKQLKRSQPYLHSTAEMKARLFRDRYTVLQQRTSRHQLFSTPAMGTHDMNKQKKFKLKQIEFLLGSTVKLGDIIVLGMLSQLKERKWYLEDPTGVVQLDCSEANFHTGIFTESSFVLAEGYYEDEVFHVAAFGFPPPESAASTRDYFGNINFFGGPSESCAKSSETLREHEQENQDAMFVFLSDVWLDDLQVMERLRTLFKGYAEYPPYCFVLCGNFLSVPPSSKQAKLFKECFKSLADLLNEFPVLIRESKFIFVPGPLDPGPKHIFPKPSIPSCLTSDFCSQVPSATFVSNPCRIQYCTQEIVVMRQDLVMKMCRNCIQFPSGDSVANHFVRTMVCQSHLCPLPLHVSPVYWMYDNALHIYPLPDLLVCADKFDPFSNTHAECTVINPGSFPRSEFSFKVYMPASREVQDSRIDEEHETNTT